MCNSYNNKAANRLRQRKMFIVPAGLQNRLECVVCCFHSKVILKCTDDHFVVDDYLLFLDEPVHMQQLDANKGAQLASQLNLSH